MSPAYLGEYISGVVLLPALIIFTVFIYFYCSLLFLFIFTVLYCSLLFLSRVPAKVVKLKSQITLYKYAPINFIYIICLLSVQKSCSIIK